MPRKDRSDRADCLRRMVVETSSSTHTGRMQHLPTMVLNSLIRPVAE